MRQALRWSWLLPVALTTACYTYTPVEAPRPGMEVRARLTTDAAARRSQGLDEPILRLDGVVVAAKPDSIELDILVARSNSLFENVTIRDTIAINRAEIQNLMFRKLSRGRSVLFSVGAAAVAFGILKGITELVGGTGVDDGKPGTPN